MSKVYLVGAGPGSLELLTLKAYRLIRSADVILYDRLINPEILSLAKPGCELVYVGKHAVSQEEINELLLYYARKKDVVVRLKGGDPFVFGRGGEEALFLAQQGIDFEVVPGVSSATGVPTASGIPLTYRGVSSSFAVITGYEDPKKGKSSVDWDCLKGIDTLVFLMAVSNRQEIGRKLIEVGRCVDEPVAFIERGTTEKERVVITTLGELAADPPYVEPPALMIVGNVVRVREIMRTKNFKEVKV